MWVGVSEYFLSCFLWWALSWGGRERRVSFEVFGDSESGRWTIVFVSHPKKEGYITARRLRALCRPFWVLTIPGFRTAEARWGWAELNGEADLVSFRLFVSKQADRSLVGNPRCPHQLSRSQPTLYSRVFNSTRFRRSSLRR